MRSTYKAPGRQSYQPPSRAGKKGVVVYLDPETAKDARVVAALNGMSTQEYLSKLIEEDIASRVGPTRLEQTVKDTFEQLARRRRAPSKPSPGS